MNQPGRRHEPSALPVLGGDISRELAQPADMVEEMRAQMAEAPIFFESVQRQGATTYKYGLWPATDDSEGCILAEELIPEQEVLDVNGGRDYDLDDGPSLALNHFMNADPLSTQMECELAPALRVFGFNGRQHDLDARGSTLRAISFPNPVTFNQRLVQTGNGEIQVETLDPEDYSHHRVVEMVANGKMPITGADSMVMDAPVWALLPPEVHRALKEKAMNVLDSGDVEIRRMAMTIGAMNLRIYGYKMLDAASEDGPMEPGYSKIDELAFQLQQLLHTQEDDGSVSTDGRKFAELTVAHIHKLDAASA